MEMGRRATEAFTHVEDFYRAFEPPKNLPHDPALRKDRRKWGGR
jgi:hypothetical protein